MKKLIMLFAFLIILFLLVLSISVFAHEDKNCEVDLEKYTSQAKAFINNNPDNKYVGYGKKFIGNNAKVEVTIDNDVWHATLESGKITEIAKGAIENENYHVYTSKCTLHEIEDGRLNVKEALKTKHITISAVGLFNRLKLRIVKMFF